MRHRFAEGHPYWFAVILTASIIAVQLAVSAVVRVTLPHTTQFQLALIDETALSLVAAVLLTRMHWWGSVGFRPVRRPGDLWLFWAPVILVVSNLAGAAMGIRSTAFSEFIVFFALAGLAGFAEESFFRGLMLRALMPKGVWRAAIVSSVFFGLLHGLNILSGGDPQAVFIQIGIALAVGFVYATLVVRTGVIWPLVILHGLTDLAGFIAIQQVVPTSPRSLPGFIVALVFVAGFIVYGAMLLRKAESRQ